MLIAVSTVFLLLGWAPRADRFTWFMENLPVILGVPVLVATHRRFPLSNLLYALLALHALVLMVGGYWTYAEVPAGHWVQRYLHLARNPYDRLGHLFQGFVPVLLFREVLLRRNVLRPGGWSVFVLILMALGLSAAYELLEWQTAVWTGSSAEAFLGTQGDPWDTQWDMACALIGAIAALTSLSRAQDRLIQDQHPN
ncbi:membrane protein [Geothrix limicola]|uniref:Membrane protein n=2 Tax=Geothrix limicola TaxID=2927978 RepID=A0ABQ5QHT8_9BACT|nr:membrane protein [Geothrix limicola]